MNIPQSIELRVRNIGLSGIACLPQRRAVRTEVVDALAQSMKEIGLINPITLRPREGGMGFYLIAGRHRYEAAKQLKWEGVAAIVLEGLAADDAELREIDENLIRADLTDAERAAHHARRQELHQQKHPETKHGGDRKGKNSSGHFGHLNERYTKETAAQTGESERTVRRHVARGKKIPNIADVVGTSLDKGDELDALAKMVPEHQSALIDKAKAGKKVSAKTELKKERRDAREAELAAAQLAAPGNPYGVIYADPPWRFDPYSRETGMDRAPDNHYPTTSTEQIAAIEINAADDAILFLWATVPMLPDALQIMQAWDFEYRSHFVWVKDKIGTGYWSRNKHELLLIGTRGNIPAPAPGTQYPSVIEAARGEHSAKPFAFREIIEHMFPNLPRIELFAREKFVGWDCWGLDAPTE